MIGGGTSHCVLCLQGIVLSAFYSGYVLTQMLGGRLADRLGGDRVQWTAGLVWGAASLSVAYLAHFSSALVMLARFVCGLAQGGGVIWGVALLLILPLPPRGSLPGPGQPSRPQGGRLGAELCHWHYLLRRSCRVSLPNTPAPSLPPCPAHQPHSPSPLPGGPLAPPISHTPPSPPLSQGWLDNIMCIMTQRFAKHAKSHREQLLLYFSY